MNYLADCLSMHDLLFKMVVQDELNSSREAADTTLDGNLFHSLAVLG